MRVVQLGDGDPDLSIIGGIHGDEPCGVRAIERLLDARPSLDRPVKLVVANEEALDRGIRYVDVDLNRAFEPSTPRDAHERVLGEQLAAEISETIALSIHSTQSYEEPFAITSGVDPFVEEIAPHLSVEVLVDAGPAVEGRLFETDADIIEVEAGYQGTTAAAENAYRLARDFLTATGALPGDTVPKRLPVYELGPPIRKPQASVYEVFAENFTAVDAGDPFAAADDDPLYAAERFWPVLLSAYGYRDIFGYQSKKRGTIVPG